ncbi:MAG: hypothetical protein ACK5YR_25280 [Pirellula sp.]|jgi:hypothetical protein
MKFGRLCGVAALVLMTIQSWAKADFVLEFGQGGTIGLTSFEATVGKSVSVDLYITQKLGETRLTTKGIVSMALKFSIDGTGGATHGDILLDIPTHFNIIEENALSGADRVLIANANNTSGKGLRAETSNSIFLGTATIQANEIGIYGFNLSLPNPPGNFSFLLEDPLNPETAIPKDGNAIFTVTAVPEPSSVFSIVLCAALSVFARIRGRKQSASNQLT